jgi:hypothetical protein
VFTSDTYGDGTTYGWSCPCGASDSGYPTHADATEAASHHGHPTAPTPGDNQPTWTVEDGDLWWGRPGQGAAPEFDELTVEAKAALVAAVRDAQQLPAVTAERDAAVGLVRDILEQITVALGLPLTEAGRPRANSFLFREIGKIIECHEWDWPQ